MAANSSFRFSDRCVFGLGEIAVTICCFRGEEAGPRRLLAAVWADKTLDNTALAILLDQSDLLFGNFGDFNDILVRLS